MNPTKKLSSLIGVLVFAIAFLSLIGLADSGPAQANLTAPQPEQQRPTPTPTPSALARQYAAEIRELRERGPELPAKFGKGKFNMKALVRAGWRIEVEYELEKGAEGNITFLVFDGWKPLFHLEKLEPTGVGNWGRKEFYFPDYLPKESLPYEISFRFKKDDRPAHFRLRGIGLGLKSIKKLRQPISRMTPANIQRASFISVPQSEKIVNLKFSPNTIKPGQGESLSYSFIPGDDFSKWAATFYVERIEDGIDGTFFVRTQRFDKEILAKKLVEGRWDGKDDNGNFSDGTHKLAVTAWWSDGSDPAAFYLSDQVFTVAKP